jgi:hypothetical protein
VSGSAAILEAAEHDQQRDEDRRQREHQDVHFPRTVPRSLIGYPAGIASYVLMGSALNRWDDGRRCSGLRRGALGLALSTACGLALR